MKGDSQQAKLNANRMRFSNERRYCWHRLVTTNRITGKLSSHHRQIIMVVIIIMMIIIIIIIAAAIIIYQ